MASPDFDFDSFKQLLQGSSYSQLDELGNVPVQPPSGLIREESFGGWSVECSPSLVDGEYERFVLRRGTVRIDGFTERKLATYHWDAELPEALKLPNKDEDPKKIAHRIVSDIHPLIFLDFPKMMGIGLSIDTLTRQEYIRSTAILVEDKYGNKTEYRTREEEGRIGFALHYGRPENIGKIKFLGGSNSVGSDFGLGIKYGDRENRDQLTLTLPISNKGIDSLTDKLTRWMLGTHFRAAELGEMTVPAVSLTVALRERSQKAFDINREADSL